MAELVAAVLIVLAGDATPMTEPTVELQGHRGARGHLPENTLPSFAKALEMGVDTLELDVGVTRDGVVVIHHDRRLNPEVARGPDGHWVSAPAPTIFSLLYEELQRYDVGRIRPGSEYAKRFPHQMPIDGTRIPRLAQLFALAKESTVKFNIETKLVAHAPTETLEPEAFARALVAEVRRAGVAQRTTIQSFDFRTLKFVEREAPEIATSYLTSGKNSDVEKVHAAGAKVWSPDFQDLNAAIVRRAHELGMRVIVWTVNEPADVRRVIEMGVDGIISDYPDRARKEIERWRR
jgi:glycerophosphoryl diester phosphodiesterase